MEAAKQPFTELREMYDKTLNQIKSHDKEWPHARKALGWLTFAMRTLESDELTEALAIQSHDPDNVRLTRQSVPTPELMVQMCRGLVTLDKGSRIVRLAHQTIQEYLRDVDEIREILADISTTCFTGLTLRPRSDWVMVGFDIRGFREEAPSTTDNETAEDEEWDEAELMESLARGELTFTHSSTDQIDEDDEAGELDTYYATNLEGPDGADTKPSSTFETLIFLSNNENSIESRYFPKDDYEKTQFCGRVSIGIELDTWAAQPGRFAKYSGRFAAFHFAHLTDPPMSVLDALWNFLTGRPSSQFFPKLLNGNNSYPAEFTPLHMASVIGDLSTCKRLLQQGVGINLKDGSGSTPLMCAARNPHIALTAMLLDSGADSSISNSVGQIAFQMVEYDMPRELYQKIIPEDFPLDQSTLAFAIKGRLYNLVSLLVELKKVDIDVTDPSGETALIKASKADDLDIVKLLHSKGANTNLADNKGWTALHFAAHKGHLKVVRFLLGKNANPHLLNESLETPLLEAVEGFENHQRENDTVLIAYLLLRHKASVTVRNFWVGTALHIAATRGSAKLVNVLLKAGCDLHALQDGGDTALHMSLKSKPVPEFISIFIEVEVRLAAELRDHGSVAYRNPQTGDTPLHVAARTRGHEVVSMLLDLPGTHVDDRNFAGRTPIYGALHPKGLTVFKTLLKAGASTDVVDSSDLTLLDSALGLAPSQIIGTLVQRSCPVRFPRDQTSEVIQAHVNESWYPQLLDLLSNRSGGDKLTRYQHIHVFREDSISVNQRTPEEKAYLEVTLPEVDSLVVRQVKFQIVSHDQGKSSPSRVSAIAP